MVVFLTTQGNQAIDRYAIDTCGIPGYELMERAGQGVVEETRKAGFLADSKRRILVLCGKGNNGGDGFVIARILHSEGFPVDVLSVASENDLRGDALYHFRKAQTAGVSYHFLGEGPVQDELFDAAGLIFDALLGTGVKGDIRPPYDDLIQRCHSASAAIVAVDQPSGVTGDIGEILEPYIHADLTISMGFGKVSCLFEPARSRVGQLKIIDIGFPADSLDQTKATVISEISIEDFKPELFTRRADAHKYQVGKVAIIAGSKGFSGAAAMAAKAALRSGAGLVKCAVPESIGPVLETLSMETIVDYCPETLSGGLSSTSHDKLMELSEWADCVALGPGLGREQETMELCRNLVRDMKKPLVLDADGLFALVDNLHILNNRQAETLLTPHAGEFARLISSDSRANSNWMTAKDFAVEYGVFLLLKGSPSLLATPEGDVYVNSTGHAGMATAGSGDVLTGVLAGLWSQWKSIPDVLNLGMYKHGEAADTLRNDKGVLGLIASDLIEALPAVLRDYARI